MQETKTGATTRKVLEFQKSVLNYVLLFSNLFAFILTAGGWLVWQMQRYAGGWSALLQTRFTEVLLWIPGEKKPLQILLRLSAQGMDPVQRNVTEQVVLFLVGWIVFLLLQGLVRVIADAVWRSRTRKYMQRLTALAEETRRIGAEEAGHHQEKDDMVGVDDLDDLEDAIHQVSPIQPTRIHTGDPDLEGLEGAINDLLDRMQAAYSQQARFVSDASHELRTPIAVLKGYADLLERWGKDDPQVRDEAITAIQNETQRMNRLVEQLLFLARGDSGRIQLKREMLDLAALLEEICEESQMIHPEHRWKLQTEPVTAVGDRDMLKQTLRILTDNAAKYTPSDGEIVLCGQKDPQGNVRLSVRDEGMGIHREDAAHVFERFFRSDPARSRQSGGAGLGLSIADWIVTSHGGHMEVYSWEGVGTKFTVVLPPAGAVCR